MEELLNVNSSKPEPNDEDLESFYKELLVKSQNEEQAKGDGSLKEEVDKNTQMVKPTPGLCVKSRQVGGDGSKVFINICTSSCVPTPKPITEEELLEIIDKVQEESGEVIDYRVPLSIGQGHVEVDNRGDACTAYDVIISPNFFTRIKESQIFFGFLMSIIIEGIQYKWNVEVNRNWTVLKNKKFCGRITEQNLRKKTLIQDISPESSSGGSIKQDEKVKQPRYVLVREPETGDPEFIIAEVELLGVEKAANVMLDVGEDRMIVSTRPKKYKLDIYLPFDLLSEDCGSQFDVSTQILTVTMPVKPTEK